MGVEGRAWSERGLDSGDEFDPHPTWAPTGAEGGRDPDWIWDDLMTAAGGNITISLFFVRQTAGVPVFREWIMRPTRAQVKNRILH